MSGINRNQVHHRPRLLSDNGSSYVAADLATLPGNKSIKHIRSMPYHPMTQGKIERWHQTLKNRILFENYFLPGDLDAQIGPFVEHSNHRRYHESPKNLTPADAYSGRGHFILQQMEAIKLKTIELRRSQHHSRAAQHAIPDEPEAPVSIHPARLKYPEDGRVSGGGGNIRRTVVPRPRALSMTRRPP